MTYQVFAHLSLHLFSPFVSCRNAFNCEDDLPCWASYGCGHHYSWHTHCNRSMIIKAKYYSYFNDCSCITYHTCCNGHANNTINDGEDMPVWCINKNWCILKKYEGGNLVQYDVAIEGKTIDQHHYNLMYAATWRIGVTSFEHIIKKLCAKKSVSNMIQDGVSPYDRCNGNHSFHRLMMISNSVCFCFSVDHTANSCNSRTCIAANDWNLTLS